MGDLNSLYWIAVHTRTLAMQMLYSMLHWQQEPQCDAAVQPLSGA